MRNSDEFELLICFFYTFKIIAHIQFTKMQTFHTEQIKVRLYQNELWSPRFVIRPVKRQPLNT